MMKRCLGFFFAAFVFSTCTKDAVPTTGQNNQVIMTTNNAGSIASNSALLGGVIIDDGGSFITSRGVVYSSTNNKPTVNNSKHTMGSGSGSFSATVSSLNSNTQYYVRAFGTNAYGNAYGETEVFRTLLSTPALSLPGNSVLVGCCSINFQWTSVSGATSYEIQISKSSTFTGTLQTVSSCSSVINNTWVNNGTSTTTTFCVNGGYCYK